MNEPEALAAGPDPPADGHARRATERAVGGIRWTALSFVLRTAVQLGVTALLARLLVPTDFGLLALALVFTSLVAIVQDFGLGPALIQRQGTTQGHASSMFWANLAFGAGLTLLLAALAPAGAWFFGEPRLQPVLTLLSFQFLLSSIGTVPRLLLTKNLEFQALARIDVVASLVGGALSLAMALGGLGVWALVGQSLGITAATTALVWLRGHWKPQMAFQWSHVRDLLSFGLNFTAVSLLTWVYRYVDNLLVGRFLGTLALGLYDFAYRLFRQPMANAQGILTKVMFPTLSSLRTDMPHLRQVYRRAVKYIATGLLPAFAVLHASAPDFVPAVYGSRWDAAIPVLQLLALAGFVQSIVFPTGWLYQSLGRMDVSLRTSVTLGLVPIVGAMAIGLQWGIVGVATAIVVATVLAFTPALVIPYRLAGLRVRDTLLDIRGPALGALTAALVIYTIRLTVATWAPAFATTAQHWPLLAVELAAAALAYLGALAVVDAPHVRAVVSMTRRLLGGRGSGR